MKTIYDFSVKDAELNDISLNRYHEKVLLVVNVASYCGLTYQYKGLEELYKKYKSKGFEILGFPCNQFALQEPGTNKEIQFIFTDYKKELIVVYSGAVPNLFSEERGAVVEGKLNDKKYLIADRILAKHDENYMPPQMKKILKENDK